MLVNRIALGCLALAVVFVIVAAVAAQTVQNLRQRGIASGFEFLGRAAEFEIAPGPLPFSPGDTYGRALAVGLFNTLRVALPGILAASVLGLSIGIARLSNIWIVSAIARVYVEVFRNTPLLLQLLFWYSLSQALPPPREALNPVSPEFGALLIGLSAYTAAFIGEIVRGGVLAVERGQTEAATALGLSRGRVLRLVVLPQAWPIIIPPATSQFVNLAKNSSLAVAIGYPELTSITNTTLNQTGQAVEAIAVAMLVYLGISLTISLVMNACNAAVTRRSRGERTS